MPPTVVFDTNVLFSAVGWNGTPRRCLELAQSDEVRAVTCAEIMEELSAKLAAKLDFSQQQVLDTIAYLLQFMPMIAIAGTLKGASPDPKDDMVLECAITAGAEYLVTGDTRDLLPLKMFQGMHIISPAELVRLVNSWSR